ncbi:MAG TPA: hypothetical protein VF099_08610, partial [Ktedonobacterales bacterium]
EEVIEDGVSGFLVEPGDAEGLADALLAALADPALLERVGQGALRRVGEFGIDAMVARLADYYKGFLRGLQREPANMSKAMSGLAGAAAGEAGNKERDSVEVSQ